MLLKTINNNYHPNCYALITKSLDSTNIKKDSTNIKKDSTNIKKFPLLKKHQD